MSKSLIHRDDGSVVSLKVSSTLNNDPKNFGKKNLTDGLLDTCWNSANGPSQHITIDFTKSSLHQKQVNQLEFKLTFQGGFTAKETALMQDVEGKWEEIDCFACCDGNDEQSFIVRDMNVALTRFRLVFRKSTDFFGRITIYNLDILDFE